MHPHIVDPLHLLEVQHPQVVRHRLHRALLLLLAVVAAEEDQQRLVEHAGLLL